MSGVLGDYRKLVAEAQRKRMAITREQQQQISGLYQEIAGNLSKELKKHSEKTLTYRWLKDYEKSLRSASKGLFGVAGRVVRDSMLGAAQAVTGAEAAFYSKVSPALSLRFTDVFSTIPQKAVDELLNGGIYKGFAGLSTRLWDYRKQFDRDIQMVIEKGMLAQKSAFDLAKDLEMYVNPKAEKPWDWNKVYPGTSKKADYNAQRLARTGVTHAYQLSFERATRDNPFVEAYRWHSSNGGRTCELCRQRNGKLFGKGSVPLDHPNGMCVLEAVIKKSYDEIGAELGGWAAGGNHPQIERWLNPNGSVAKTSNGAIMRVKESAPSSLRAEYLESIRTQSWNQAIREDDGKALFARFDQATDGELRFWEKYGAQVQGDFYTSAGGYYSPADGKVYLQLDNVADPRVKRIGDAADTRFFFHETGHLFDYQVLADGSRISTRLDELGAMLESDAVNHANAILGKSGLRRIKSFSRLSREQKQALTADFLDDMHLKNAISDLYDGLTGHKIAGAYGHHQKGYWKHPGAVEREAVAHLFEAKMMKGERLGTMKAYFPKTFEYFEQFIKTLEG